MPHALFDKITRLRRDENGASAIITAIALVALCGAVGLGIDTGMWYRTHRAMQNAADAAAIAAARDGSANYQAVGKAVAARYGFVNGTSGATVLIANGQPCPGGTSNCYSATVTQPAPRYFTALLNVPPPTLSAAAMSAGGQVHSYCLIALGTSGTSPALLANGVPKADLSNCSAYSGTDMTCHGHNLNADYADAVGTDNGCGNVSNSNVSPISDPYSSLHPNIPTNTCSSYPQEPSSKKDPPLPSSNQWSGSQTLGGTTIICGDLQLTGDTTLSTTSPGSVLVIENGQLDTNGHTLQTAAGSYLTIVFSGTAGSYTHAPTGGGTLTFQAPTSGEWQGIAIYQDPALTTGVDISAAGNSPTWNITGVVYLPHSSVTLSGAVGKSDVTDCFVLVVDNITFNGTGAIEKHGGCAAAGVVMPTDTVGSIALVK
jgi:Flp pilus assembly protein TadG